MLNAGFDQIFNLYSPLTYSTGDIIDTYVYRQSLVNGQYSFGTAVGLFKSSISLALTVVSYRIEMCIRDSSAAFPQPPTSITAASAIVSNAFLFSISYLHFLFYRESS